MNLQRDLYGNIILSGGSTNFPSLRERLKFELSKIVPNSMEVDIHVPPERELSTWVGGLINDSLQNFSQITTSRE